MNTTRIVTIICWAISAVALLGLITWFLTSNIFGTEFGSFGLVGTHSIPADSIDSMSIEWIAGAVNIRTHDGDEIQITEFARRGLRENEHLRLNTDNSTLAIYFTEHQIIRNNMPSKQLEVLIPYSLSENFESFNINTISGRIEISDIHANDFTAGTVSGRIELSGITSQALNASTTSGRITLSSVQAEEIYLQTVTGRIEATNTQTQSLHTNTVSGRHELSGDFGRVNTRSTSGRVEITSTIVPEHLAAHTTSGRIQVAVPNEGVVSVQYSTSSRFSSEIPISTHGGADAQFNLSTSSGRISIFELPR